VKAIKKTPINNLNPRGRPLPVMIIDKNENALGHHGVAMPIHVNPTNIYILSLFFQYLRAIRIPTNIEIDMNIRLNNPFINSSVVKII